MADFDERSGLVLAETPDFKWSQTRDEVVIFVPVPSGIRGRDLDVEIKTGTLKVAIKPNRVIIAGPLDHSIKPQESVWTLEDSKEGKEVRLVLQKALRHEMWNSVVRDQFPLDPITAADMQKKMMLEKFQSENPGFDFSGAEFTGQVPSDPNRFGTPD